MTLANAITLERVLSLVRGLKKTADNQWRALCPCHDDRKPSLSVSTSQGQVLFHCHAGCPQERLFEYFKQGQDPPPKGPERKRSAIAEPVYRRAHDALSTKQRAYLGTHRELSDAVIDRYLLGVHENRVTIPILDESGRCLDVRRWLPPERRGNGAEKILHWKKGFGGPRLFPLDQLEGAELTLVEGEMDALACISHGIPAITITAGASTWPNALSAKFSGKEVTVLPDNDEAGLAGARKRADSLARAGARVAMASWPDDREHGWDATDELRKFGAESLKRILGKAQPYRDSGLVRLADIEPVETRWLWRPYIPLGKVTLVEGDPGQGKSWLTLAIASVVSTGGSFPDGQEVVAGRVLLLCGEDGLADTVRPRLDALGANVGDVSAILEAVTVDADGCSRIDAWMASMKPDLVILDPLVLYLGAKTDLHRANETREPMKRLADLAEKHGAAVVCVRHLSKAAAGRSIYRGLGSIDITALARSALLVGCDPAEPFRKAMVHHKSNLAGPGPAMGFELDQGRFLWTGKSDLTADRILAAVPRRRKLEEAAGFLEEILANGPVPAEKVLELATARSITERSVHRAKQERGVVSSKTAFHGGRWVWSLPDGPNGQSDRKATGAETDAVATAEYLI